MRVVGLGADKHFQNDHRVLNRARWSGIAAARILLGLLIAAFVPAGTIVIGLDETIERRCGKKIKARGIDRDAVLRSSHSDVVKGSGRRWLWVMLLAEVSFARQCWALPFLSVLCPSERFERGERGRRHLSLCGKSRKSIDAMSAMAAGAAGNSGGRGFEFCRAGFAFSTEKQDDCHYAAAS